MSHSLEIPDDLYKALQAAAEASGTTQVGWIAAHLSLQPDASQAVGDPSGAKTLADLFEGEIGLVESSGDKRASENCGEKFTDYLEAKRKAGHL